MLIGDVCKRDVVCAAGGTTVTAAAEMMRAHHIGDVVVVDREDAERMPIGIVTDRDIVIEVVAAGLDPTSVTVGDLICWGDLATVQETDTYADTLRRMHDEGVRRMPVVNSAGVLVGIVSLDDFLPRFVSELSEFSELVERGRRRERQMRASPTFAHQEACAAK